MSGPLLEVRGLCKSWQSGGALGKRGPVIKAVDGVSFTIDRGEALALVGESGCGKTTTAQCVLGLERPDAGTVLLDGSDVLGQRGAALRDLRRRAQLVYQDPYESLDPRQRVRDIVSEPLRIHRIGNAASRRAQVAAALEAVELDPPEAFLDRLPHQLSGGQRQRVAIATSLVVEPQLLVADEPVSMLDVSVRAGVLAAIARLRRERDLAVLVITHDLSTIGQIADRVAVMHHGQIVETGPVHDVLHAPQHPYTQALIAAVPSVRRRKQAGAAADDAPPQALLEDRR